MLSFFHKSGNWKEASFKAEKQKSGKKEKAKAPKELMTTE